MNGPHDLGGQHGFGPVAPEADEPLFHATWERRAFALVLAMGGTGAWNIDMSRHARERIPPAEYLASSYYAIWLKGMERLLVERGLATEPELRSGRAERPGQTLPRKPTRETIPAMLAKGGPADRPEEGPARFSAGDRVRAKTINPQGHTRLPRYVRGRVGRIERVHGTHVFPDSNAAGLGENPCWLYSVAFAATEVWGEDARSGDEVLLDLWEPYLSRPEPGLPGWDPLPSGENGPVFPAPWAARAFALAVALNERDVFSWSEWAEALGAALRGKPGDDPEAYWRAWLSALEEMLARQRIADEGQLVDLREAWRQAAEATPHGEAIELARRAGGPC